MGQARCLEIPMRRRVAISPENRCSNVGCGCEAVLSYCLVTSLQINCMSKASGVNLVCRSPYLAALVNSSTGPNATQDRKNPSLRAPVATDHASTKWSLNGPEQEEPLTPTDLGPSSCHYPTYYTSGLFFDNDPDLELFVRLSLHPFML